MQDEFPIFPVNREDADDVETLGTKPKFWWFNKTGVRLLFKAEDRGTGEDWAEKITCHLCELLDLPHVHYELALERQHGQAKRPGVICENMAPAPLTLILGNQLLFERDHSYPLDARAKYNVRAHTVSAIVEVLGDLKPPRDWPATDAIRSGLDVFIGYLLLDAWVANQDRHHGNWGAIRDEQGALFLSPTFDHGAALARLLTEEERRERLTSRDRNRSIAAYVTKARSACYADAAATKTLGSLACFSAFSAYSPRAAQAWRQRLEPIDDRRVSEVIERIPERRMSKTAKAFTLELLRENKRRLLQTEIP